MQIVCFFLYNGRLHPLAKIIDKYDVDETGKSKYWIYITYDIHKSKLKYVNILLQTVKGQLISICLYGVFTFFQKTNENKSTSSRTY